MSQRRIPERLHVWIDARTRHRLSHAHVQMARELGLNPKKLGTLDDHEQAPWKLPLPEFIKHLYFERFGKRRPDVVVSIEERARVEEDRKTLKREMRRRRLVTMSKYHWEFTHRFLAPSAVGRARPGGARPHGRGDPLRGDIARTQPVLKIDPGGMDL